MKMVRTISILLITLTLAGFSANPEPEPDPSSKSFISVFDNKRKRADRHFHNFEYKSAIKLYNKLAEKGKADDLVKLRLAESYLKINDHINAEKWYAEVIHSPEVTPQHQIQYAHTLLSNGKYDEARTVINSYEFADSDYRSKAIINTLDRLETFYADSSFYYVNPIDDNRPQYSDFSPITFKNGIVFVSSRTNKGPKFKWDETPFLDLYYTETDVASAQPFSEKLNSKYHEGPITFYDNYTRAIFTRSNYLDKEFGVNQEGINNLQLYTANWDQEQNDWNDIEPVNFVIGDYSYGHPSITADDSKLYFISDMPGGYGGTDIYVSDRIETGWSDPINMGELVNTAGNEMYPFVDDQNNLYFASNGHGGLGGLDVFQIQPNGPMDLKNMGYPLNTTADDFGFSLSPSGEIAYISSNREGVDNIYKIDIQAPNLDMILADNSVNGEAPSLDQQILPLSTSELSTVEQYEDDLELSTIKASVIDENNEALNDADLKLMVDNTEMQSLLSDESGKVSLQVAPDQEYTIIASKEGFEDRVIVLPAESLGQQEDLLIVLSSIFVNSDSEEIPTTELDPLAVSGDPWEDSVLDQDDRPAINGVALSDLPDFDEPSESETPTTELDPLAVSDDPWSDSGLDQGDRPAVNGVALADLPDFDESSESETPTTELDPLAVSDDPWSDSGLDQGNRPEVNGVALADLSESDPSQLDSDNDPFQFSDKNQLVQARVVDAITGKKLDEADLQLYVESPNQELNFQLKDGILTFEADPNESYMIVASHNDYQDKYANFQGSDLLARGDELLDFALAPSGSLANNQLVKAGPTKFKVLVKDEETRDQLQDAEVKFFVDGEAIESEYSKDNGKTVFKSPLGEDYMILVSRDGYQDLIYYLPGAPEENMDVELAMLRADNTPYSPYRTLAINAQAFDDFSGQDLEGVTFDVFEDGDWLTSTQNLSSLQADPGKDYRVMARKEGYQETLQSITSAQLSGDEPIELPFAMKAAQISEATGSTIYQEIDAKAIPVETSIIDISDNQPISEATVMVFADNMIQNKLNTWESGMVTINLVPGKDYQLLVKREGYNNRIIDLDDLSSYRDGVEIALIPQDIQRLKPSEIDLNNANMLVMAGPDGQEQLYLSTNDNLYKYTVENGHQYLSNDSEKILLEKRTRSVEGKRTSKQGSDQFNLRAEDQFLYDELTADEKELVDKVAEKLRQGELDQDPDLTVYYNNLPEEYRNMVDHMAQDDSHNVEAVAEEPLVASSESLNYILAENRIAVTKVFNVNNIYYDFDKSNIREDAALELDKLVAILKSNRNIKVAMFSHTDSRGSNLYNDALSVKRGKAAIQYLLDKGIGLDRLTTQGRGESQLVNSCLDATKCSEDAHQLNRRTEFMLSM